jgi:ribonuclease J
MWAFGPALLAVLQYATKRLGSAILPADQRDWAPSGPGASARGTLYNEVRVARSMGRPTLTFLGGVREIGGNKILIEDGPDRVLFDFGPSFSPRWEEFYVNYLQPRSTSPAKDLLEFGLVPRIEGLYSRDALADADLAYHSPEIHAIFVSHAHADHAGHLNLVDPEIPVYVGEGTRVLLDAIENSTAKKYGEHDWRTFQDRTPVRVGRIEVVPYPVDHSIPFAYGFLIRTSEGTIVYTGDFRHHGPRAATLTSSSVPPPPNGLSVF